jgi:hypothetical protein
MTFKPNTRDLETIAIMGHARAATAQITAALGITEAEFSAGLAGLHWGGCGPQCRRYLWRRRLNPRNQGWRGLWPIGCSRAIRCRTECRIDLVCNLLYRGGVARMAALPVFDTKQFLSSPSRPAILAKRGSCLAYCSKAKRQSGRFRDQPNPWQKKYVTTAATGRNLS